MLFNLNRAKKNSNFIPHYELHTDGKVLIVSDLHLGLSYNKKYNTYLINTLHELSQTFDHLIINGDLFETWKYGFVRWSIKERARKVNKIMRRNPGIVSLLERDNVYYIAGNHDFSVRWAQDLPFQTYESIYIPELDTHIEHGNNGDPKFSNKQLSRTGGFKKHILNWLWDNFSSILATGMLISKIKIELAVSKVVFTATGMNKKYVKYGFKLLDQLQVSRVVFGHTHVHQVIERNDGKVYANSGHCLEGIQGIILDKAETKKFHLRYRNNAND